MAKRTPPWEELSPEEDAVASIAKDCGTTPAGILELLREAGWQLKPYVPPSDEAKIFSGFPPMKSSADDPQRVDGMRKLADYAESGDAVITSMSIVFKYYHVADNDDGYELRTGLVQNLRSG